MKKTRIILICAVIIAFACLIAAGCSKTEKMTTIELKDVAPDSVIELQIGAFDYSAYTVLVNYDSGSVEEIALSENMIAELDRLKFYQPGDHTVTIFHSGKTCDISDLNTAYDHRNGYAYKCLHNVAEKNDERGFGAEGSHYVRASRVTASE